uniref:Carboxylic ester hydrolase n=1 Tax=Rhabditophanes sp. KR3021 TaxID=114890 RepID=A0AC35TZB6_9BILA
MVKFVVFLLCSTVLGSGIDEENVDNLVVKKLEGGFVEGRKSIVSHYKRQGIVFLGIPFAQGISDIDRFNLPKLVKPWEGILKSTDFKQGCLHNSAFSKPGDSIHTVEDCLNLNVYTSKTCIVNKNCSVLFFIHGGRNLAYSANSFDEETIIDNFANEDTNIIVVTVDYRLGVFGYLNLNPRLDLSINQNLALFDVVFALKWVQREIDHFGGDPKKVTLSGYSSGADMAHYIYLSSKSKGLFSQFLQLSGSRLVSTTNNKDEETSRFISIEAGCATTLTNWNLIEEVEKVILCLKGLPPRFLADSQRAVEDRLYVIAGVNQDYGINSFFEKDVDLLAAELPPIPFMGGTTEHELSLSKAVVKTYQNGTKYTDMKALAFYCEFSLLEMMFENQTLAIELCIADHKNDLYRAKLIIDEMKYFIPALRDVKNAVSTGAPAFFYNFEYPVMGDSFITTEGSDILPEDRPAHVMDCIYFLGNHKGIFVERDYQIRRLYIAPFVNFIKTGNPTTDLYKFDQFDPKLNNYFPINFDENLKMPGMKNYYKNDTVNYFFNKLLVQAGTYQPNHDQQIITNFYKTYKTIFSPDPIKTTTIEEATIDSGLFYLIIGVFAGFVVIPNAILYYLCFWRKRSKYNTLD